MTTYLPVPEVSPEVLAQMREWIADCMWPDLDPTEVASLSARSVVQGVLRHFDGGLTAFLLTCEVVT